MGLFSFFRKNKGEDVINEDNSFNDNPDINDPQPDFGADFDKPNNNLGLNRPSFHETQPSQPIYSQPTFNAPAGLNSTDTQLFLAKLDLINQRLEVIDRRLQVIIDIDDSVKSSG